jgi:hypothetical protein
MFAECYLTNMESLIPTKEMATVSLLIAFALCIVVISLLIASCIPIKSGDTLELANIIATSILGSAAAAIAAIELKRKSQ